MNRKLKALQYLLFDFAVSYGIWIIFFLIRRQKFEDISWSQYDVKFMTQFINAFIISAYWIFLYALAGLYTDPYRKSRLKEVIQVFNFTLVGVLIIFFAIFIDDPTKDPMHISILIYLNYFLLQFAGVSFVHIFISTITNKRIRGRKMGFPTIIIGSGNTAFKLWTDLESRKRSLGFNIQGYLSLPDSGDSMFYGKLKHFGKTEDVVKVINNRKIEEVIIALDKKDKDKITEIVDTLELTSVRIKIVPEIYDYILGLVKTTQIMGSPLIEINPRLLSTTEVFFKRAFDIAVSIISLLILSPVMITMAILIKLDSKGPVFFFQERIGKGGKPFRIIKFRTMRTDAEKAGPALSTENDPRITRIGRFMRKTRVDEFPQFLNVLKGEMSIVGPRPERQFFIDQIVKVAPHYKHLHRVRPGITSWGQVKYGYASSVDEMVERMTFDILYIENISLLLDLKILIYTVVVMIEGRGK